MSGGFKEYTAHIPQRWAGFDSSGPRWKKQTAFNKFMPKTQVEAVAFANENANAKQAGKRRQRMCEKWTAEMHEYIEKEAIKNESKERAAKLDELQQKRQERALAKRERALVPPTVDGKPMPANFYTLRESHPHEVERYQQMVTTASDLSLQHARTQCDEYLAKKQDERERAAARSEARIRAGAKRAQEERLETVHEHCGEHNSQIRRTLERQHELQVEREEDIQTAHEKALRAEAALQARRDEAEQARSVQRDRRTAEAQAKLERMAAQKERVQNAFEAKLRHQMSVAEERMYVLENTRHNRVEQRLGEKAYERAMAGRAAIREHQISDGERRSEVRKQRLDTLAKERNEALLDLKATHKDRQARVETNKDDIFLDREEKIHESTRRVREGMSRSFSPSPRRTPGFIDTSDADESLTAKRVKHAHTLLHRRAIEHARHMQAVEERQNARDAEIAALQSAEHHATAAKLQHVDERRRDILMQAAERAEAKQRSIDEEHERRAAAAEQRIRRAEREKQASGAQRSVEKNLRILACLDEVNVEKQERLIQDLEERRQRRGEFEAQLAAERQRLADAKLAERASRQQRMSDMVAGEKSAREQAADEARRKHDERCQAVAAQRDQHLRDIAADLAVKAEKREAQVAAAAAKLDDRQSERRRAAETHETAAHQRLRSRITDDAKERERARRLRQQHLDEVGDRHMEFYDVKRERAEQKVAYASVRAATGMEIRSSPMRSARPRTTSPGA